ncbi:MAG: DUF167 domain-containing protein [Candidatus Omnitrophica bacterium]|nr:DUF167 domain-containing protein [Candidatus Omnitrophota bacterium]MDD5653527.1 DUF167 domain-containing protein [Candidatus Omnitrophota bacterium]
MRITVKVKANSKQEKIEKISESEFKAWIKEPAIEGRANEGVVEALSDYFSVPKSRISIIRGQKNKIKIIEII